MEEKVLLRATLGQHKKTVDVPMLFLQVLLGQVSRDLPLLTVEPGLGTG